MKTCQFIFYFQHARNDKGFKFVYVHEQKKKKRRN